jgi:hypothetical protein
VIEPLHFESEGTIVYSFKIDVEFFECNNFANHRSFGGNVCHYGFGDFVRRVNVEKFVKRCLCVLVNVIEIFNRWGDEVNGMEVGKRFAFQLDFLNTEHTIASQICHLDQ